ncbi:MAG TPA: Fic family protein [Solirubrobacteraceae bacterium]|nr:Fic family protein [Solirubrobacteraceae bacterium]
MNPVYSTPTLQPVEAEVLEMIDELREQLRNYVNLEPRRWYGTLRRMSFARAVQGSNSIEGYDASLDDVVAVVDDEPTLSAGEETGLALNGYRDAMTYVLQIAQDAGAKVDAGLLKSLHFMMLKHRLDKDPGRWRPGDIYVVRESTGEQTYEGPPADAVPELVAATIEELEGSDCPVLVRAAMAHLNLVMVHPFRDGNGRMARALQTLVLAREDIRAPVFSSIEEYLGRNTEGYYEVLGEVGAAKWNPQNDARPWLRYCLRAHYFQARTQLRRVQETESLYGACAEIANRNSLPERTTGALAEAAYGLRLTHSTYKIIMEITAGETISGLTASRDLKALVDAKLLQPVGRTRGRYYVAEPILLEERRRIQASRAPRDRADPFKLATSQLRLDIA